MFKQSYCGSPKLIKYVVKYKEQICKILIIVLLIHANGSLSVATDVSAVEN